MAVTRTVDSHGVRIVVREHSPAAPGRATVVLVHGYPDQQTVWHDVVAALPIDRLHVVTYDVRGAGASGVPATRREYRSDRLVDDLAKVLDAVLQDGEAAHLVGHDWGSVQLWDAVAAAPAHPGLRGRIASFTSISGPSLTHVDRLLRHRRGRRLALVRQLMRSWYVVLFLVPGLPELVWRHLHRPVARVVAAREGLSRRPWGEELGRDAVHGLDLYRANFPRRLRRPGRGEEPPIEVPVQVVRPTHDGYLTDVLFEDLDRLCADVRVVTVDGGHWVARTHPEQVAAVVLGHVQRTAAATGA